MDQGREAGTQYVFLNDTLVAPIDDQTNGNGIRGNVTTRAVWVPPGTWIDAWTGQRVFTEQSKQ